MYPQLTTEDRIQFEDLVQDQLDPYGDLYEGFGLSTCLTGCGADVRGSYDLCAACEQRERDQDDTERREDLATLNQQAAADMRRAA